MIIPFQILSQTPYNSDFEEWETSPSSPFENPVGWKTSNGAMGFNILNVTKTSDQVYSGKYAAKLESVSLIGFASARGTIGIYEYDPIHFIRPGGRFTKRPDSISGQYIFYPVDKDENFISLVYLTKWNGESRDTIGLGSYIDSERKDTFTRFVYPIEYRNNDTPDSILFGISSLGSRWPGTTIIVDNIQFIGDFMVNADENPQSKLTIYPNPANEHITLKGLKAKTKVEIFDINGTMHFSEILDSENSSISTLRFPPGLYCVKTLEYTGLFKVIH